MPSASTLEDALRELASGGAVITDYMLGEGRPVYLYRNFQAERAIGERLFELMDSPKKLWASKTDILSAITWAQGSFRLTAEQKGAIHSTFVSPVSVLTGGPGTGKTQTLQVLVQAAKKLWPGVNIRICAPTGKAAMRAQELTGAKASTIHRALGYPHNNLRQDELVCDLLIADEYSMCDADLCSWLLRALNSSARLLIVGDHEQLPSVGPGLVLRDMIQSEMVPVNRLTQVFRQGGGSLIVQNAHAIIKSRPGAAPEELSWSAGKGGSFYFIQANDHYKIQRMMVKAVKRMLDAVSYTHLKLKQSHEMFANFLLENVGSCFFVEKMSTAGLSKRSKKTKTNPKTGRPYSKKRFGKSIANHAPSMFVDILTRKAQAVGGSVVKIAAKAIKASQYDHTDGSYTKAPLSRRWKRLSNGDWVQRDLYSAFLLSCLMADGLAIDQAKCKARYDAFKRMHDDIITKLRLQKAGGKKFPKCMGI